MPMQALGEWLPDQQPIALPGLTAVDNVYPTLTGYRSFSGRSEMTDLTSLSYQCRGAASGDTQMGVKFTIAGTREQSGTGREMKVIWNSGDWIDITPSGTELDGFAAKSKYDFTVYGDRIIAVGRDAVPISVETSVSDPGATNLMSSISADASSADVCESFKEFLILGNVVGRGANASAIGTQRGGLHWSAIGQPTNWPEVATQTAIDLQSDFQILDGDGGEITAIVAVGEWCAVFRERQVWRMDYVGGSNFFSFRKIDSSRGCIIPGAAIALGGTIYFPSFEGFLSFDGSNVVQIGEEKVDRTWRAMSDFNAKDRVTSVYNAETESIYWTVAEGSNTPETILAYRPILRQWFQLTMQPTDCLFDSVGSVIGGNLDQEPYASYHMDTVVGTGSAPADWITVTSYNEDDTVLNGDPASAYELYAYKCVTPGGGGSGGTRPTGGDGSYVWDFVSGEFVAPTVSDGSLDWLLDAIYDVTTLKDSNMDELGIQSGERALAAIDSDGKMHVYNNESSPLEMSIVTGDFEAPDGGRGILRWIRPIYSGLGEFSGNAAGRLNPNSEIVMEPLTWKTGSGVLASQSSENSTSGLGQVRRVGGRYLRAEFVASEPLEKFSGFDYELRSPSSPSRTQR